LRPPHLPPPCRFYFIAIFFIFPRRRHLTFPEPLYGRHFSAYLKSRTRYTAAELASVFQTAMYCQFPTHRCSKTAQGLCSLCFKDIPHCFCFASSKLVERWRTPAPNAVHRIANTPTFSTTDVSLTTFFRFPPEIRLQIYRLLLIADCGVKYHVSSKNVLPSPPELREKNKYRHGLFPAILETCRTIHREANPILYEKNELKVNCGSVSSRLLELPCSSVLQITKIHLSCPETCSYQSPCSWYGGSSEARSNISKSGTAVRLKDIEN
jgi:hypothetical protein